MNNLEELRILLKDENSTKAVPGVIRFWMNWLCLDFFLQQTWDFLPTVHHHLIIYWEQISPMQLEFYLLYYLTMCIFLLFISRSWFTDYIPQLRVRAVPHYQVIVPLSIVIAENWLYAITLIDGHLVSV